MMAVTDGNQNEFGEPTSSYPASEAEAQQLRQEKGELVADRLELEDKEVFFKRKKGFMCYTPEQTKEYKALILSYIDNRVYEIETILNGYYSRQSNE